MRFLPFYVLAAMIAVLFVPTLATAATADPNPAGTQWVDGAVTVHQPSLTTLDFAGSLALHKYTLDKVHTAAEIADDYQQAIKADQQAAQFGQTTDYAAEFVKELEQNITKAFDANVKEAFPHATVTTTPAVINKASLAAHPSDPYNPGVQVTIAAHVARSLADLGLPANVTEDQVHAAFEVGAVVGSSLTFTGQPGEDVTYTVIPPPQPANLHFLSADGAGASLSTGNLVLHLNLTTATAQQSLPVAFTLGVEGAPHYSAQKANLRVDVDLKDVDITFGKAIGGDLGNLIGEVNVRGELNVIEIPADVKSQLGDKVKLDYLSSDGLRLLKARGLVDDAKIASLQDEVKKQLADKLQSALGTKVDVTATLDAASLNAPVSSPLSDATPIVLTAHASFTKPLSGGSSGSNGAAIALYKQAQSFDLPKVNGLDTTYTVTLPKGLAVVDLAVTGGSSTQSQSSDGRDSFTVTPQSDTAHATVTMAVTPAFVFAHFLGVVLVALLLLVLIIATPIAIVVLRRRKKKQA